MRHYARRIFRRFPRPDLRGVSKLLRSRATAASLVAFLSLTIYARCFADINTFVISHEDGVTVHETYTQDPHIVLMEVGIPVGEYDYVSLPEGKLSGGAAQIEIIRAKTVEIHVDGETHRVTALGGTVADALSKTPYTPNANDLVMPEAERLIEDGMQITVTRFDLRNETERIYLPYETERVTVDSLEPGVERVATPGAEGLREIEHALTLRNGELVDRRLIRDELVSEPVNEIIEVGAEKPVRKRASGTFPGVNAVLPAANAGVLTLPDGTEFAYTHSLETVATAYTTERQTQKRNASGKIARTGTIAVDPKVIPLGTTVYVVASDGTWVYGTALCEDTGGSIKGAKIDLFFDKYDECVSFGRRNATVYIIEKND